MPSAVKQQYLNIAIVPNIAGAYGRDHLSGVLKLVRHSYALNDWQSLSGKFIQPCGG